MPCYIMCDFMAQDSSKAVVSLCNGKNTTVYEDFATRYDEGVSLCKEQLV
jgi:hypothetical protein